MQGQRDASRYRLPTGKKRKEGERSENDQQGCSGKQAAKQHLTAILVRGDGTCNQRDNGSNGVPQRPHKCIRVILRIGNGGEGKKQRRADGAGNE